MSRRHTLIARLCVRVPVVIAGLCVISGQGGTVDCAKCVISNAHCALACVEAEGVCPAHATNAGFEFNSVRHVGVKFNMCTPTNAEVECQRAAGLIVCAQAQYDLGRTCEWVTICTMDVTTMECIGSNARPSGLPPCGLRE